MHRQININRGTARARSGARTPPRGARNRATIADDVGDFSISPACSALGRRVPAVSPARLRAAAATRDSSVSGATITRPDTSAAPTGVEILVGAPAPAPIIARSAPGSPIPAATAAPAPAPIIARSAPGPMPATTAAVAGAKTPLGSLAPESSSSAAQPAKKKEDEEEEEDLTEEEFAEMMAKHTASLKAAFAKQTEFLERMAVKFFGKTLDDVVKEGRASPGGYDDGWWDASDDESGSDEEEGGTRF